MVRFIGKGFLAGGFLLGIYGLTEGHDVLMRSGLGLLAAREQPDRPSCSQSPHDEAVVARCAQ
ncbi:MAG: hypothetical protein AUI03_04190 [Nitrospirae bacterium 13_2_20CM_2_62_8]|nr:MAG: hypothetical protein AUI03_04190 [Nitrospirae bacterium 13_2_20CM_2_62_8]